MLIVGHEKLEKSLKRLSKNDSLSHGYVFFGELQVGKFTFAKYLANYLETGEFDEPTSFLSETLFINSESKDGSESIGIDEVRKIKQFLYKKPVMSKKRVVIIDNAEELTTQAQNAILKIAEEPPPAGLLILIVPNPEAILSTLQSRFQKVYFPRSSTDTIKNLLIKELKISVATAVKISEISYGRIGRAKDLASNQKVIELEKEATKFLKNQKYRQAFIKKLTESDKTQIKPFITAVISELGEDIPENCFILKSILARFTAMSQLNLNKRLQLETALLWNT